MENCLSLVWSFFLVKRLELKSRNVLSDKQHADRIGSGTETYFACLENVLNEAKNKNYHTDCAVVDLTKAFDRTWRPAILELLKKWGFGGSLTRFVKSFLTDRICKVLIGAYISNIKVLENGVPQGAILSPTLFLISTESLLQTIPTNIDSFIYADDIILITPDKSETKKRTKLQKALNKLHRWCCLTGHASTTKSKILHICNYSHKRANKHIKIKSDIIPNTRAVKILGDIIDNSDNTFSTSKKKMIKSTLNILHMLG